MHNRASPFLGAWLLGLRTGSEVVQPRAAPFLPGAAERGSRQRWGNQPGLATSPAELGPHRDLQADVPPGPWTCLAACLMVWTLGGTCRPRLLALRRQARLAGIPLGSPVRRDGMYSAKLLSRDRGERRAFMKRNISYELCEKMN